MCDLSPERLAALREMAEAAEQVTVDSATLLSLLNPVMVVTIPVEKKRKAREKTLDPEDASCAHWLFDVLRATAPSAKEPNFTTWANEVRLMRERDGRTRKEICALFRWAHGDAFWRGNILSPKALREHWDRLTIQRTTAAEPKKRGDWWASDETKLAKAIEVGVGRALPGESPASWEARIRAAIDNGGKPPAPQVFVRPVAPANDAPAESEQRMRKPAGFLKDMLQQTRQESAA